ncbi:MAG: amidase, hydantoinase/carbamoylase family [Candidatus Solibacter sp.]|nr:amidase, hydantoinase/carbamoylase family [Candidatus Solibacter sp.]
MTPTIDSERLSRELAQLAAISEMPLPAVTRVVFSPADLRAREYVRGLCEQAGLIIHADAVGNTFVRWTGDAPELPAVGTGSHIDAIPNAGSYDGTVGVLGGLEAIRALQASGFRPHRSIELLIFTAEEPTRFGIGCLGSRFLAGLLDEAAGERLRDGDGRTLNQVREAAGFTGPLESTRLPAGYYSAFVELHIEQGPLLERAELPLGIVTAIAAPAALRLRIEGEGGHAGAVLMPDRRDAFLAAAEIALAAENAALTIGAIDTVATCGICNVFPGAINSIPSRVEMTLDVRDIDERRRDAVLDAINVASGAVASRRGVYIAGEVISKDAPAICDRLIVETLEAACEARSLQYQEMVSRAYHDSLFVSRFAPTAMLFIPCRGGVSHRPDEYASPEAIAAGAAVLADTLARLSLLS